MIIIGLIVYINVSLLSCVMIHANIQRRGAFDIGSGATKLQVSDVSSGKIVKTWFGEERPCSFGML
jgi:hypothetical protein